MASEFRGPDNLRDWFGNGHSEGVERGSRLTGIWAVTCDRGPESRKNVARFRSTHCI